MKLKLISVLGAVAVAVAVATPANAEAPRKLEPAPKLRLPPYGPEVLELTAERLADVERRLRDAVDRAAAEQKKRDQTDAARREWEQCRAEVEARLKPRGERQFRKDQAQIDANSAEIRKFAAEAQARLQNAKTPEEMQRIMAELAPRQQALLPSAAPMEQLIAEADREQAKCGAEPAPAPALTEGYPGAPRGFDLMIERVAGFCTERPSYVGPDGSLSTLDIPFNRKDKGMMSRYNVEVYSPKEAAQLEQRCGRLAPLLKSRGRM